MRELVSIRASESGDKNFILNSWLKSYRDSDFGHPIPKNTFFVGHHEAALIVLDRSEVYCAVSNEDSSHIYGWICIEPAHDDKAKTLHYIYVKHPYRGFGIAKMLLHHALEEELYAFTHLPDGKFYKLLTKHGHYDPYRFFGGNK